MENINNISNNIVKILTSSGSGSGFYLADKNIIVTNYHVVPSIREVGCETINKDRFVADVVLADPHYDIALLRPQEASSLSTIQLKFEDAVQQMDRVYVLGFPFGLPFTITDGIVSSNKQLIDGQHYIQTDAAVNPGNSGGPLVNNNGDIIGISSAKFENADNIGFAIPAQKLIEDLAIYSNKNTEHQFSLKCSSCDNLLFEKEDYCPNCGNNIKDSDAFDLAETNYLIEFLENAISAIGINPIITRSGYERWELRYHGLVFNIILVGENQNYVSLEAHITKMPKKNIEEFYRYALSPEHSPFRIAVCSNHVKVMVTYRFSIFDLVPEYQAKIKAELIETIKQSSNISRFIVEQFGAEQTEEFEELKEEIEETASTDTVS